MPSPKRLAKRRVVNGHLLLQKTDQVNYLAAKMMSGNIFSLQFVLSSFELFSKQRIYFFSTNDTYWTYWTSSSLDSGNIIFSSASLFREIFLKIFSNIYSFSSVIEFSSEEYIVSIGHRYS